MAQDNYLGSELWKIRHSTAHVMAQAVRDIFPEGTAKIAIGPPIADGFYYDFDLPRALTPEDLEEIEKKMRKVLSEDHEFNRRELSADEAREIFKDQPYKQDLIDGLESGGVDEYGEPLEEETVISIYTHDDFVDLCRGPHVESTKLINPKAIKLLNVAGAYWRGDEHNSMLQRIYGTAWATE
ncbi:MAG: threonine--tRNA ligase, partial [Anaerolineales bacterium]|nr:threonine--tRNA ligase [Anaerolineales bacterium]